MLKIIIGANSGIQISPNVLEALKNRGIQFTLELDLLNDSYIELEMDNKTIVLHSDDELIKILDHFDEKRGDDFNNGNIAYSNNVLSYIVA
ncbi:MAG: hypothetical protein JZD40_07380 [Sulfolobus sp.]|nr:hypothetical protein [Sulfolobus sp.]